MSSRRRRQIQEDDEEDLEEEIEEENDSNAMDVKDDPGFSGEEDPVGKYRPGSIRRIKLKNFLTYAKVEFSPGPRLNMVVGANGTGKSTILNAICLGLGGEPKHLGRADDARAFIQNGKDEAMIEIELEPLADKRVPHIFRRDIDRSKGKERGRGRGASTYYMNGQKVKSDELNEVIKSKYNIDLSNLCTFLPQDRVGNFSGMTPQDLLIETQKTLSKSQHLYTTHQELIQAEEELNSKSSAAGNVDVLEKTLEAVNRDLQNLERGKELFEQREQALKQMGLYEAKHIWMRVDACLIEARDLQAKKKELKGQVREANKQLEPLSSKVSEFEEMKRQVDHEEKRMDKDKGSIIKEIQKQNQKFELHEDEIEDLTAKTLALENRGDQNQKEIREAEGKVTKYTKQLAEAGVDEESFREEYKAKKEASKASRNAKHKAIQDLQNGQNELHKLEQSANDIQRKLSKKQDMKQKQLDAVFSSPRFSQARRICNIIQQNRDKFRSPVQGPVATLITPKPGTEIQYAAFLEQHVSDGVWKSFVVGSKEDQDTLYRLVREEQNIPITIIAVDRIDDHIRRPYSDSRMKQLHSNYGIEGYLDQKFDAPPNVMQALRTQSSIHTVFVGGRKTNDAIEKSGLLTTLLERENGGAKQNFVLCCPNEHNQLLKYNTRVSEYSGKESTRIDQVRPASFLLASNPESDRLAQRLQKDLEAIHDEIRGSRKSLEVLEKRKNDAELQSQECHAEFDVVQRRFKLINELHSRLNAAKTKLERAQEESRLHEENAHEEKRNLRLSLQKRVSSMIAAIAGVEKRNKALLKLQSQLVHLKVKNSKIASEYQKAEDDLNEAKKAYEHLQKSAIDTANKYDQAKKTLARLREEATEQYPLADEEGNNVPLKAQLEAIDVDTIDDLEALIEECQQKANNIAANPEVIKQYNDKTLEKRDLEEKLEDAKHCRDAKMHHIDSTLAPWEAQLTNLMAKVDIKFSQYMAEMGFTGSVELSKGAPDENGNPRNFKDWGITIKVSFRDGVKAQVLSARVQSGGERSVSTIMYLMALQDMMVAPFRCVDEINQGLDESNERGVFRRIVANSCQPPRKSPTDHEGQYFLVTPKLLPNLYDMEEEAMTVLFVFNGNHSLHRWHAGLIASAGQSGDDGEDSRPSKKRKST